MKNLYPTFALALALSSTALCFPASAAGLSIPENRAALELALREIAASPQGDTEAAYLRLTIERFAAQGVRPGPLCLELGGACRTRDELGYRAAESFDLGELRGISKAGIYTSISEARLPDSAAHARFSAAMPPGVSALTAMLALDLKERLERAFLVAYGRTHRLPAPRRDGSLECISHWEVNGAGRVHAEEACTGTGDSD